MLGKLGQHNFHTSSIKGRVKQYFLERQAFTNTPHLDGAVSATPVCFQAGFQSTGTEHKECPLAIQRRVPLHNIFSEIPFSPSQFNDLKCTNILSYLIPEQVLSDARAESDSTAGSEIIR